MRRQFEGELHVSMNEGPRQMRLLKPFCYIDSAGQKWPVPKGASTDGASIPRILWSLIGGPFEGHYRKPAVVHDYYCDVRVRPWPDVHYMFYEAMLVAGVSETQAKIMYYGVRLGGPRWSAQAQLNTSLQMPKDAKMGSIMTNSDRSSTSSLPALSQDHGHSGYSGSEPHSVGYSSVEYLTPMEDEERLVAKVKAFAASHPENFTISQIEAKADNAGDDDLGSLFESSLFQSGAFRSASKGSSFFDP